MTIEQFAEQINSFIEKWIKTFRPQTIEDMLENMPSNERAKYLPALIPAMVDGLKEATNMSLDASLALKEFLLGQGLGLSELDIAIASDTLKMAKVLEALKQYQVILAPYKEYFGENPAVEFIQKTFTYKLIIETFKDIQLPPGWSAQDVAGLLEAHTTPEPPRWALGDGIERSNGRSH